TEAEWEYAARGGIQSKGYKYSGSNNIEEVAWYTSNSDSKTHTVGATKKANELGIYDMSGNVWEWCSDYYDENYYKNSPKTNPQGAAKSDYRSLRGGSWGGDSINCRVSIRGWVIPSSRNVVNGFRVVWVSQDK
ncbi:MAG TPA: formylglycine-generating enzyme family protein, partial [Allocoleopsis sp.]